MSPQEEISTITSWITDMLKEYPDYFLVDIALKPVNNIKVFLDADKGVAIDMLAKLNKMLYKEIVSQQLYPEDDFSLEVSSYGLEKPFKLLRQYYKNEGRKVECELITGIKESGILINVTNEGFVLKQEIGKKREEKLLSLSFSQIKTTKVSIVF